MDRSRSTSEPPRVPGAREAREPPRAAEAPRTGPTDERPADGDPGRRIAWVRDVQPFSNPAQTDRSQGVLPFGTKGIDPFIGLMEDWFSTKGFDWHPHRGFETVTMVLEGELEHTDNAGGHGVLGPGDVQWTTTGRGVIHAELARGQKPVHTLQLWFNLPSHLKMSPPRYQDLRASKTPVVKGELSQAAIFAGEVDGVQGPAETLWPATLADIHLGQGGRFDHEVPEDHVAFFYVVDGHVDIAGQHVKRGQVAWSPAGGTSIALQAADESHVVAYSGKPIGEPVVSYGPFVMNTKQEIEQAIRDYQAGEFGPVPER